VNLSTLSMLSPLLHADTLELLYEARGRTKAQMLELLARHAPKPDVPDSGATRQCWSERIEAMR
jgi:hypothetical protein